MDPKIVGIPLNSQPLRSIDHLDDYKSDKNYVVAKIQLMEIQC